MIARRPSGRRMASPRRCWIPRGGSSARRSWEATPANSSRSGPWPSPPGSRSVQWPGSSRRIRRLGRSTSAWPAATTRRGSSATACAGLFASSPDWAEWMGFAPGQRNLLTDVAGIHVGHADSERVRSGTTVVVGERGVVAGCDVRGGAPGTRETDCLRPGNLVGRLHAVVLSGGSVFGLGGGRCRRGAPVRCRHRAPARARDAGDSDCRRGGDLRPLQWRREGLGDRAALCGLRRCRAGIGLGGVCSRSGRGRARGNGRKPPGRYRVGIPGA